jgi:hypothetical protein
MARQGQFTFLIRFLALFLQRIFVTHDEIKKLTSDGCLGFNGYSL